MTRSSFLPTAFWARVGLACLPMVGISAVKGQEVPAAKRDSLLLTARQQNYNLRAAGAKSYTCDVVMDWDGFLKQMTGKAMPADDPTLAYLKSVRIRLKNDLDGNSDVQLSGGGAVPEGKQAGVDKLQAGIKQMVGGFVQAWTPTLNGTIIPAEVTSLRKTPTGYLIVGKESGSQEMLNDKLQLVSIMEKSGDVSSTMMTTFEPSAKGLLMVDMGGTYQVSASAPATKLAMKTSFAMVQGFELPATLTATIPNVATFSFKFVGCTVEKAAP